MPSWWLRRFRAENLVRHWRRTCDRDRPGRRHASIVAGHLRSLLGSDDQAGRLLGDLRRRLRPLGLAAEWRLEEPLRLNDAGRLAAQAALRAGALRPWSHPCR